MGYEYAKEKPELLTESGITEYLLPIRENARRLLKESGAFEMDKAWKGVTGSSWQMIAAIDFMVEHKELIRVTPRGSVMTQSEVYIRGTLPV
jgi:hypothetical protein